MLLFVYENDERVRLNIPKLRRPEDGDVGYDLHVIEGGILYPRETVVFRTGLHMVIPNGYGGFIWDRSGMGKNGLRASSALYTDSEIILLGRVIDSSYRGEIGVALSNLGSDPYEVKIGDRVAQLVILPCVTPKIIEARSLSDIVNFGSKRGQGGFGSSGR